MKRIVLLFFAILLAIGTAGQTIRNGAILEFHHFTLHLDPDVTFNQWKDFALNTYLPLWESTFSGIKSKVIIGERGDEKQKICWLNFYDTEEIRSKYFKEEGMFQVNELGERLRDEVMPTWEELSRLGESDLSASTDWVVLPINQIGDQELQKGNMLGVHYMHPQLKPDVTMNQYLDFLANQYMPRFNEKVEGWKVFLLRADRGDKKDSYMWLYWIESIDARDRYVPEQGKTSEEGKKIFEELSPLLDELNMLGTWSTDYTDWVVF